MLRSFLLFFKIALVVAIAVWFVQHPGHVEFEWQGYVIETYLGVVVAFVLFVFGFFYYLYSFITGFFDASSHAVSWYDQYKHDEGYKALTQSMVAIAAGDPQLSIKFAKKAQYYLDKPPLTLLLMAQASQLNGDEKAAEKYFRRMLDVPDMSFLGTRGLLMQSLKEDNMPKSLSLARHAYKMNPQANWSSKILYDLECKTANYHEALEVLETMYKQKQVDQKMFKRQKAILLAERARRHESRFLEPDFQQRIIKDIDKAYDLVPDFVPIVLFYADVHLKLGEVKRAVKAIEKCWQENPHPDLLEVYKNLRDATQISSQIQFIEKLILSKGSGREIGYYAIAELAMRAMMYSKAREYLNMAAQIHLTQKICNLFSKLEMDQNSDEEASVQWLVRMKDAHHDSQWFCGNCNYHDGLWHSVCPSCHQFDTYVYDDITRTYSSQMGHSHEISLVPIAR